MRNLIFYISIFLAAVSGYAETKIPRLDGHWATCAPLPTCQFPPIGCFKGGKQCGVTPCACPDSYGLKDKSDANLIKLANEFADKKFMEGVIEESGKQELIDFVLKVLQQK
ncbi:MAG TPA: hypothetical protein PKK18_12895 [Chitinophagales bacterium]|nr:hypothetical protein [Chitinophagales bacterium]HNA39369.1 hypothetical protein [Chitinophagales bacterium]HNF20240.1 hypothetical protein [Chitinophagales bacterium]HNG72780.1 hypothetical protein [Chitinophagales bacterium]HNK12871.1 hypothetical protein [Chitinophagales bacterium]